jgi:hypothetical protein
VSFYLVVIFLLKDGKGQFARELPLESHKDMPYDLGVLVIYAAPLP